jgi:hypothetical protein
MDLVPCPKSVRKISHHFSQGKLLGFVRMESSLREFLINSGGGRSWFLDSAESLKRVILMLSK